MKTIGDKPTVKALQLTVLAISVYIVTTVMMGTIKRIKITATYTVNSSYLDHLLSSD